MKKHQYLVITIFLLSTLLLPGCTENQITQPIDTDGDGYNNTIDLFPNDPSEWQDTDNDTYETTPTHSPTIQMNGRTLTKMALETTPIITPMMKAAGIHQTSLASPKTTPKPPLTTPP